METRSSFSERYGIGRPPNGLVYEDVPNSVRDGFLNSLENVFYALGIEHDVYRSFLEVIDRWAPDDEDYDIGDIAALVTQCTWNQLFDIAQKTVELLHSYPDAIDRFINSFNQVLRRNYVGYEFRGTLIERIGAREADVVVAQARGILHDPQLGGPDEQFQKAIGFFNQRPQPDVENCVKDAVGAVEALAEILLGKPSIQLNDAIKEIGEQKGIHKTLQQMVEKLYAYKGDAPGAGHGKTSAKPPVRIEDAEFVLSTSAACIVYLARLYGKAVE
jgi:hypothetical protein